MLNWIFYKNKHVDKLIKYWENNYRIMSGSIEDKETKEQLDILDGAIHHLNNKYIEFEFHSALTYNQYFGIDLNKFFSNKNLDFDICIDPGYISGVTIFQSKIDIHSFKLIDSLRRNDKYFDATINIKAKIKNVVSYQ